MSKYSYEEKLNAVKLVIENDLSYKRAARITGVGRTTLRGWVIRYRRFGPDGIKKKHSYYSGDFKVSVIEYMHDNYLSLTQTAELYGIPSVTTVNNWERIYYREGPEALYRYNYGQKNTMRSKPPKKKIYNENEEDLLTEVRRLRMENEYLKKLQALVQERINRENGNEPPSSKN